MTVRSKRSSRAEVVALPAAKSASGKATTTLGAQGKATHVSSGADLLSIRQHLTFKASVGITDFEFLQQVYSEQVADKLMVTIRGLLDQEFGSLRVHRRHQFFIVNHHDQELLIAGLLRVQYHSRQVPLTATRDGSGLSDVCGIPLVWGAGRTLEEAEQERDKKHSS